MASPGESSPRRILQSWKEIAAYLGVTVRTVQRWEDMGLPTYRQGAGKKARVFAYEDELRRWIEAGHLSEAALRDEEPEKSAAAIPSPVRLRRRRLWWPAAFSLAALALALAAWWVLTPAPVPHGWRLREATLDILDAEDRVCWSVRLPQPSTAYDTVADRVVVADIDGDGRREVLLHYAPPDLPAAGSSIMCFEHDGKKRWERKFGAPKQFGGRTFEHAFRGKFVRPVTAQGRRYVVAVGNHFLWYPSQVALLNPRDGEVVQEYWHPGAIYHVTVSNFDKDKDPEILFGAINNPGEGLGHAAVGLLDVPLSKAALPADSAFPAITGGGEKLYALFPLPDASRVTGQLPIIREMHVDENRRIRVQLPQPKGVVVYYLDYNFEVLHVQPSDEHAGTHEELYRQKLIDHRLTPEETAELGKVLRFPAAPDANSLAVNQLWKYGR